MNTVSTLISTMLDWTDAEIVTALNASTVRKTDTQRWTWAGLALRFGPQVVGQIDETLKSSPGYDWVRLLLAGGGIDFSEDQTQTALEALRPTLGDMTDSLKAIGVWQISPWTDTGNTGIATVDDVTSIRAQLATDAARRDLVGWWATVCNEIVNPYIASGKTRAEIIAAIAEVA